MRYASALAIIGALALVGCATMANQTRLELVSDAGSQPYQATAAPGTPNGDRAAAHDYTEEEYFLSGTANVYRYGASGGIDVETAGLPYTTRLLVTRPRDPARFSGRVFLNPLHPMRGGGAWESVRDYALRNGDAFVSVLAGADERTREESRGGEPVAAPLAIKASDPARYARLDWPEEDGIRWDVFSLTALALRARGQGNPLRGLHVRRLYAVGWSFTGSFLRTFINDGFHDRTRFGDGAPAIDGYLVGISHHHYRSGYVPINSHTEVPGDDDPRRRLRAIDVPVIEFMTESEAVTPPGAPIEERDSGLGRYRLYEVPGVTHGDGLRDAALPTTCPYPRSDVPFRQLAWAALDNLDAWVERGAAPPRATKMQLAGSWNAIRDAQGNAVGGLRPAQIAVPLARYGDPGDPRCAAGAPHYLSMFRTALPRETLRRLYPGGAADYLSRFEAQLDKLIAERWLLPEEKAAQMEEARAQAATAF
ncbi:MAG: hypothetical protein JNJ73_19385 [Hyphomonadaceae bacterium]|nr:hypothetical protein [Hyphomonadaceae bacterium]